MASKVIRNGSAFQLAVKASLLLPCRVATTEPPTILRRLVPPVPRGNAIRLVCYDAFLLDHHGVTVGHVKHQVMGLFQRHAFVVPTGTHP